MLTDIALKEGFARIQNARILFSEVLIPSACGKNPNSTYRTEYDWLFTYERILAGVLEPWTAHLRYELIGEKGILCEALSNAFCHGHKKDPLKPIQLSIYLGDRGLIVRIMDDGPGFDLKEVKERFTRGKSYFHLAGNGFRLMIQNPHFQIFFTDGGSAFNLMYLF